MRSQVIESLFVVRYNRRVISSSYLLTVGIVLYDFVAKMNILCMINLV